MTPSTLRYPLFVVLTLGFTAFIGYNTFLTARLLRRWRPERNLLLIPEENLVRVAGILLCLGLGWLSGLSPDRLGWTLDPWRPQVGVGILVGVGLALLFYVATQLLLRFTGRRFYSTVLLEHVIPASWGQVPWVLLALVPVVGLEELLFRSLLLGGLAPLAPEGLLLVVLGALFGLMHSPQGLWGMVGASLAGIVFGLLFLRWHSLVAPFVAHYVANGVQILLAMPLREQLLGRGTEPPGT